MRYARLPRDARRRDARSRLRRHCRAAAAARRKFPAAKRAARAAPPHGRGAPFCPRLTVVARARAGSGADVTAPRPDRRRRPPRRRRPRRAADAADVGCPSGAAAGEGSHAWLEEREDRRELMEERRRAQESARKFRDRVGTPKLAPLAEADLPPRARRDRAREGRAQRDHEDARARAQKPAAAHADAGRPGRRARGRSRSRRRTAASSKLTLLARPDVPRCREGTEVIATAGF